MKSIIKKFGQVVGNSVYTSPARALNLLKIGYKLNYIKVKIIPDRGLLPHQKYVSYISNRAIIDPLD
ncbi:MAG: hypothetical protein GXZ06_04955, partial [Tissierellia bacterium]|nr:hypothetical protein [Tissierellia bacterium]